MKKSGYVYKIIAIIVSCLVLAALYNKVDMSRLSEVFSRANLFYAYVILFSFVLIYVLGAYRWKLIVGVEYPLGFREALNMMIAAAPLNIIVPSKMGSFSKAYFITRNGYVHTKPALSMVIYEKLSDMAVMSLIFVSAAIMYCRFNLLITTAFLAALAALFLYLVMHIINIPRISIVSRLGQGRITGKIYRMAEMIYGFSSNPALSQKLLLRINALSLALWFVHTAQVVLFFKLLRLNVPVLTIIVYMLCAIVVGSLPVSLAGIGIRDISIVYLFRGMLTYNEALAVGVLGTLRNVLPALAGLPFFIRIMFLKTKGKPVN